MSAGDVLRAAALELGLEASGASFQNVDEYEMQQLGRLLNAAGEDIARRTEWPAMYDTIAHIVPGGTSTIDLPLDFHEFAESGLVLVRLSTSQDEWQIATIVKEPEVWRFLERKPSARLHCFMTNDLSRKALQFMPQFPAGGSSEIRFAFLSRNWVEGKDVADVDGDTFRIPERLLTKGIVWRWRRQKGMPYDDYLSEYEAAIVDEMKAATGRA